MSILDVNETNIFVFTSQEDLVKEFEDYSNDQLIEIYCKLQNDNILFSDSVKYFSNYSNNGKNLLLEYPKYSIAMPMYKGLSSTNLLDVKLYKDTKFHHKDFYNNRDNYNTVFKNCRSCKYDYVIKYILVSLYNTYEEIEIDDITRLIEKYKNVDPSEIFDVLIYRCLNEYTYINPESEVRGDLSSIDQYRSHSLFCYILSNIYIRLNKDDYDFNEYDSFHYNNKNKSICKNNYDCECDDEYFRFNIDNYLCRIVDNKDLYEYTYHISSMVYNKTFY